MDFPVPFLDAHAPSTLILHGLRRLTVPLYLTNRFDLICSGLDFRPTKRFFLFLAKQDVEVTARDVINVSRLTSACEESFKRGCPVEFKALEF